MKQKALLIALCFGLTANITLQATVYEVFIGPTGRNPYTNTNYYTSTVNDPYSGYGNNFQYLLETVLGPGTGGSGHKIIVNILPGTYEMKPLLLWPSGATHYDVEIIGHGSTLNETTLKLSDNAAPGDEIIAISNNSFMDSVVVKNLTLDCNWNGQPQSLASYHSGFKLGGIRFSSEKITVEQVRVTNWGSNRAIPESDPTGREAFAISVNTASRLPGPTVPVLVKDCVVDGFDSVNFGYCTGIIVSTHNNNFPQSGNFFPDHNACTGSLPSNYQRPIGCVNGYLAVVINNIVDCNNYVGRRVEDSIGLGASRAEAVGFFGNTVINAKVGFNADTPPLQDIDLAYNNLHDVQIGISMGSPGQPAGALPNWAILENDIRLNGNHVSRCTDGPNSTGYVVSVEFSTAIGIRMKGGLSQVDIYNNDFWAVSSIDWVTSEPIPSYIPIEYLNGTNLPLWGSAACGGLYTIWNDVPVVSGNAVSTGVGQPNPYISLGGALNSLHIVP